MGFQLEDVPICPHCEKENDIDESEIFEVYSDNGDRHDVSCYHCGEAFVIQSTATYTFCTEKTEDYF